MSVVDIHKIRKRRPHFDRYIGREAEDFYESKWSNPNLTLPEYELYIRQQIVERPIEFDLSDLKDKRLGCWCVTTDKLEPLVCHGQILLKLIKEFFTINKNTCLKCDHYEVNRDRCLLCKQHYDYLDDLFEKRK